MFFFFNNMHLELTLASYLLIQGLCEDCRYTIHSDSGEIQSINYPNGYPGYIQCTWDISSVNGTQLSLYFDVFDIEFDANCGRDSLTISFGGPGEVKACGNAIHGKTLISQSDFFHLVFHTDGNDGIHEKGFHAIFNVITHDVESTVVGARMSATTETGEHPEVRSFTPTGDSLSSIASIKDTTTLPQATVTVPQTIVSVKQTTLSMDTPLDKPQNHGGVGTVIAASLGAGVAIVIVIGLLILFIKRKRSIPKTKIPSNITDDSSRMYPIEASGIETHIESASPDSNDMPRNQDVYAVPMKKGFRKEEIYHESLTEYIKT